VFVCCMPFVPVRSWSRMFTKVDGIPHSYNVKVLVILAAECRCLFKGMYFKELYLLCN
jgi:hypothetical protein